MYKRILSLLLAVLLTVSAVSLVACSETKPDDTPGTVAAETDAATDYFPDVAKQDYNKAVFHMVGYKPAGDWYYAEHMSDTQNVVEDAIYEMDQIIMDHLNIEMAYTKATEQTIYSMVSPSMASGDDDYQMCILHPYCCYNSFIEGNHAYDLYTLDSLNLDKDYWNKPVIDSLAIDGHAYIGLGALCWYDLAVLYCNKNMMRNAGRTVPYADVRDGTWTMDAFYALTQGLYADNGDGMRNNLDTYGFAALWDVNGCPMLEAAGFDVARRNEDGAFVLLDESERLFDFYDGLYAWSQNESTYLWRMSEWSDDSRVVSFDTGRVCFTQWALGSTYLKCDFDVGILPLPKYDKSQDSYRHCNWGNNIIVPSTIKNPDMVGDVLELMSFLTSTGVHEAYYDTVLQYRVSNSPDDREMVELIYHTVVYDPGIAFCQSNAGLYNIVYLACFGIIDKNPNLASYLKSNRRSAQNGLDATLRKIRRNQNAS